MFRTRLFPWGSASTLGVFSSWRHLGDSAAPRAWLALTGTGRRAPAESQGRFAGVRVTPAGGRLLGAVSPKDW